MSIWGTARDLPVRFAVGQGSEGLPACFEIGQASRDLPARIATRSSSYRDLNGKFFVVYLGSDDLPSKLAVRHLNPDSVELYAVTDVVIPSVWGISLSLLGRFDVGRDSENLYAILEIGRGSAELGARAAVRSSSYGDLIGRSTARQSASDDLGSTLIIRSQAVIEIYGLSLIRGSSFRSLVCEFFRGLESSQDLPSQSGVRRTGLPGDLSSVFEVGQGSTQLKAGLNVTLPGSMDFGAILEIAQTSSTDFAANFEVKRPGSETLPASFEAGQNSRDLSAGFEVGWGYVDLAAVSIVRNVTLVDLLGKISVTHSVDLSGRAVVGHPGYPGQLKAILSIGLTNTYLDLRSNLAVGRSSHSEILGTTIVRHAGSAELFGICWMPYLAVAELPGGGIIRNVGSVGLSCSFSAQRLGDLYAKFTITAFDCVMLIADDDLVSFLNYVVTVGEGFIGTPTVENDGSEKMVGADSFKITSAKEAGGAKEVMFGTLQVIPPLDLSRSEGIAFYWWGSGGVDQNIDFEMKSPTGGWVGKFPDGPAEWRWVFLSWDDLVEVDLDGTMPNRSNVTGFFWTYHTDGVRRVDYIVGWRRQDLRGDFEVRQEVGRDLRGDFVIRREFGRDLLVRGEVGQGSESLIGRTAIMRVGIPIEVFAGFEVRHEVGRDLSAEAQIA